MNDGRLWSVSVLGSVLAAALAVSVFAARPSFADLARATVDVVESATNLGSAPADLTVTDGHLFFSADDGLHGRELWQVDSDGIVQLACDVLLGAASGNPRKLGPGGTDVYFVADRPATAPSEVGVWLYHSRDLSLLWSLPPSAEPSWLLPCGRGVLFDGIYPDRGRELGLYAGQAGAASMLREFVQGPFHGVAPQHVSPYSFEGMTLFKARTRQDMDWQLWLTDGTPEGTRLVRPDPALGPDATYGEAENVMPIGSRIFFSGAASLWIASATPSGEYAARRIPGPGIPKDFCAFQDVVYFQAEDREHGLELWRTDGTPDGTWMVKDIHPGLHGSAPYLLRGLDDGLVFNADDGEHGVELWRSDGTAEGTELIKDIHTGPASANTYQNTVYNGCLFFAAEHAEYGEELWRSDGTTDGTVLVKDIHPGPGNAEPYYLTVYDELLYFCANDGSHGEELWRSDGTAEGTRLALDIRPASHRIRSSHPAELTPFAGDLYFVADDVVHGAELWVCEAGGIPPGPAHLLQDIRPGNEHSDPEHLTVALDRILFAADDGKHGKELWQTDGTPAGTRLVADLCPGPQSAQPHGLTLLGDVTYFAASPEPGREAVFALAPHEATPSVVFEVADLGLDGTVARMGVAEERVLACIQTGEGLVHFVFCGGSPESSPRLLDRSLPLLGAWEELRALSDGLSDAESRDWLYAYLLMPGRPRKGHAWVGTTLVFAACSVEQGCELWSSDGSLLNAHLLKDCYPGPASSAPDELTLTGDILYFAAERSGGKRELWQSDGTPEGTDVVPNVIGSAPEQLAVCKDELVLTMYDPVYKDGARLLARENPRTGIIGIVPDVRHAGERPYDLQELAVVDKKIFFAAAVFGQGHELCAVWGYGNSPMAVVNILSEGPYNGAGHSEIIQVPVLAGLQSKE